MTADTRTDRNRWAALYVLCGGLLMIVLDEREPRREVAAEAA